MSASEAGRGSREPSPPPLILPGMLAVEEPADPLQALAVFYRAFDERDTARMEKAWEHSSEASVISPLVGVVRGWAAIRAVYDRGLKIPAGLTTEFYDYSVQRYGDLCVVIGRERGQATSTDGTFPLWGQATNLLHRAPDGVWRMLHHHVSVEAGRSLPMDRPT